MKPNSQCSRILRYLQTGKTLTPLQAFRLFGTLALHSRIAEIRAWLGWYAVARYGKRVIITTRMVKRNGKWVGQYRLG